MFRILSPKPIVALLLFSLVLAAPVPVLATDPLYEQIAQAAEAYAENTNVYPLECKGFVQQVLNTDVVNGIATPLTTGYRSAFLQSGYWITYDQANRGDLIQLTDVDDPEVGSTGNIHTAIIRAQGSTATEFEVTDANWGSPANLVHHRTYDPVTDAVGRPNARAYFYRVNDSGYTKSFLPVGVTASGGGLSTASSNTNPHAVVFSPTLRTPFVAWNGADTSYSQVWRFEGTSWMPVGASGNYGGSLAFNSSGVLHRAWYNTDGSDNEIFVQKLVNGSWADVGTGSGSGSGIISNNTGDSVTPRIAFDSNDVLYVAWHDNSNVSNNNPGSDYEIYVRKFNSGTGTWDTVGTGSASGNGISGDTKHSYIPKIVFINGTTPVVFWGNVGSGANDRVIWARKFNGTSWVELNTGSASGNGVTGNAKSNVHHGGAVVAPNGNIYLSWTYVTTQGSNEDIHIKKFDPSTSTWSEVGSGSASGGGIISNSGTTWEGSVAVDSNNTPYIAWSETNGGNFEIYVKKFNGTSWDPVATGSGSGAGISNTAGDSKIPMIAIGLDNNPIIAWKETVSSVDQIYVKSYR